MNKNCNQELLMRDTFRYFADTPIISVEYLIFIFETTKNLREGFLIDDQFSFALSKKSYHCAKLCKTDNRVLPRFFDKCVQYCEKYPLPRSLRFYKSPEKDR